VKTLDEALAMGGDMSSEGVSDELGETRESWLDLFGLRLYAVFLIYGGVAAVGGMIQGAFQGSFSPDLGFLGILIGRGLLMRMEFWRAWAVFVAWCGIILIPVGGILYIFSGDEPELILGLEPPGQTIVFAVYVYAVALFAFSLWIRKILAKEAVRKTFSDEGEASDGWWLVFFVIAGLNAGTLLVVTSLHQRVVDRTFDQLEYYEAIVEVVDSDGRALNPTVHSMGSAAQHRNIPRISSDFLHDESGVTRVQYSWLSTGPIEVTVSAECHLPKNVQLTGMNDGETIRVVLTREDWANDSAAKDHEEPDPESQP
jgi:hypothetical protein